MAGAIILADQPTGAGSGTAGVARKDLWLGQAIHYSCAASGNTTFLWELLRKPPSSTATFTTPNASTTLLTADVVGTYFVRLTTNGGGAGNVQTRVYRVRYNSSGALANRGWAYPAPEETIGESNYDSNDRGYAEPFETILEDIRANLGGGGGGGGGGIEYVIDSGAAESGNTYNTLADLYAASHLVEGVKNVFVAQSCVIPAGTYDLSKYAFFALGDNVNLEFTSTSALSAPPFSLDRVNINANAAATLLTLNASFVTHIHESTIYCSNNSYCDLNGQEYDCFMTGRSSLTGISAGLFICNDPDSSLYVESRDLPSFGRLVTGVGGGVEIDNYSPYFVGTNIFQDWTPGFRLVSHSALLRPSGGSSAMVTSDASPQTQYYTPNVAQPTAVFTFNLKAVAIAVVTGHVAQYDMSQLIYVDNAGNCQLRGPTQVNLQYEDVPSWDISLGVSGALVTWLVIGQAATSIRWKFYPSIVFHA